MKKTVAVLLIFISFQMAVAQTQKYDWKNMAPEQRKEIIRKMSPEDRMALLKEFRENMMVSELGVPQEKEPEFIDLYSEYQAEQNRIKSRFSPKTDYRKMSDEEAAQELNKSFEIGQQLLDNRKRYADKFMKVLKPQQVLRMYQTEGKMRSRIMEKTADSPRNTGIQRKRP